MANRKKYNIHQRIFDFVVNDQEADGALTKKDFIKCYTIVRKESKETNFWLSLIAATNPSFKTKAEELVKEGKEIVAIVSSIINNALQSKKDKH